MTAQPDLVEHDRRYLWTIWTVGVLGLWLMLAPATLGYRNPALWVRPSGGRGPWFSDALQTATRADLVAWNDVVTGAVVVVLAILALRPARPVVRWLLCACGIWLVVAPVVLWAPTASAYATDSLVGIAFIALTILIPGMPNMAGYMEKGKSTPPGWSYNPSSWAQRSILIVLGLAGLLVSRYLAAYQLGYVTNLWDPFFGWEHGTRAVLDSQLSHRWPVSDAGLGGVAYTFEFLMGWMGGPARWRTMPWMVTIFGILVIPLGLAHVGLVMAQPAVVHHWCTFCIFAAACMLPMVPLEVDEVIAMFQHVADARRRGDRGGSLWKVFWLGGAADGCTSDHRSPSITDVASKPFAVARASLWGSSAPPGLVIAALSGVALMCAPSIAGVDIHRGAADVAHLGGAFVLTVSIVAMGEVLRRFRWCNLAAGAVMIATILLIESPGSLRLAVILFAATSLVASVPRGRVTERYGAWTP